jgi:DNA-binding CsgD family transcriptional regulator
VSAIPVDFSGRDAIVAALDLVAHELAPLVATFFTVTPAGLAQLQVVHGSHLPPAALVREVRGWQAELRGIDPVAPAAVAPLRRRVVSIADVSGVGGQGADATVLRRAYRRIGAINEAQLLIREDRRLVAGITLWRSLRADPWMKDKLRVLEALQPLIEAAYLAALRSPSPADQQLPATLTPREREVARLLAAGAANAEIARALGISPNTAKSHARAVLTKLGLASRRDLVIRLGIAAPR